MDRLTHIGIYLYMYVFIHMCVCLCMYVWGGVYVKMNIYKGIEATVTQFP